MAKQIKYGIFTPDAANVTAPNQQNAGLSVFAGTDNAVETEWALIESTGINTVGNVISVAFLYIDGVTTDSYVISPTYNFAALVAEVTSSTASPVTGLVAGNSSTGALAYSTNPVLNPFYPTGIPLNGNAVDTVRYTGISTNYLSFKEAGAPQLGVYDSLLDQVVLLVLDSDDGDDHYAVFKTDDGETATILSGASGYQMTAIGNNGTRIVVGYYDGTYPIIGYSDDNLSTITFVLVALAGSDDGAVSSVANNGGSTWVATLNAGEGAIIRSTDNGETWTTITPTDCILANKVIWDGTQFVLVGQATGDVAYLGTSTAGATWAQVDTTAHDGASCLLNDITEVGTTYIITGTNLLVSAVETDAVCLAGTDLDTLTATVIVDAAGNPTSSYGLAATTGIAVAVVNQVTYFSDDNGATWTVSGTPSAQTLSSVSYHIGSSRFISSGNGNGIISYSPDGDVWTDTTVDALEFYATVATPNLWMKGE